MQSAKESNISFDRSGEKFFVCLPSFLGQGREEEEFVLVVQSKVAVFMNILQKVETDIACIFQSVGPGESCR